MYFRKKKAFLISLLMIMIFPVIFLTSNIFLNEEMQTFPIDSSVESRILIDDPVALALYETNLNFSTYFGGSDQDFQNEIAVDSDGSCYVVGRTYSNDFPTKNAYNDTFGGICDGYISKFSANGSLLWSTYFGGADDDMGNGIAIGNDNCCYVVGTTFSSNFPILNANDSTHNGGQDGFVAKFNADGSLLWSTFIGGNYYDGVSSITIGSDGSCFIVGFTASSNFPILDAYDSSHNGSYDVFTAKFTTDGILLWSTFIGGTGSDRGLDIALASDDSCYITGETTSSNFPTLNAYANSHSGGLNDAFVTKFSVAGSLLWSTFIGGSETDTSDGIAVDSSDNCIITGSTASNNFPTSNAYDDNHNSGTYDAYVTKFSAMGSLLWSTLIGGESNDYAYDVTIASDDHCFVTGMTSSSNFPIIDAFDSTKNEFEDVFIVVFSPNCSLLWSTFLGGQAYEFGSGIVVASDNSCIVTGITQSTDFPTVHAFDSIHHDVHRVGFLTKFSVADKVPPNILSVQFSPSVPTTSSEVTFSCNVTDDDGILSVTMYYRINSDSWNSTSMEHISESIYQIKLGPFTKFDFVQFYITAIDNSTNHNTTTDDFFGLYYSFTIPNSTPVIVIILSTVIPGSVIILGLFTMILIRRRKTKQKVTIEFQKASKPQKPSKNSSIEKDLLDRRLETMKNIVVRYNKIDLVRLKDILEFNTTKELDLWLLSLPKELEFYIDGNDLVIPQKRFLEDQTYNQSVMNKLEESFKHLAYSCYECGFPIDLETTVCPDCSKEIIKCVVCKLPISFGDTIGKCSLCEAQGHITHMQEWVKTQGKCPQCLQEIPLEGIVLLTAESGKKKK